MKSKQAMLEEDVRLLRNHLLRLEKECSSMRRMNDNLATYIQYITEQQGGPSMVSR